MAGGATAALEAQWQRQRIAGLFRILNSESEREAQLRSTAAALKSTSTAALTARLRLMRGVAVLAFVGGVGLTLWSNHQRTDRLGAELYMSHLFPPALRVARPVPADRFVEGLAALQPVLDAKAKEAPLSDGGTGGSDEE